MMSMDIVSTIAHFFTPRRSNNYRARILHSPVLLLLLVLFVFSQKTATSLRLEPGILGYASQISPSEVIRLTNIKRQEAGLSALSENGTLAQAAKLKGEDMLAKGYWAHVAPDGTQPWDFFKSAGYKYRYAGENLARDFTNPTSAVDAWMASASHKENMLSDHYKEIGVAVVEGNLSGQDTTIIVQLFGAAGADRPQIPVAAAKEATPRPSPKPTGTTKPTASPAAVIAEASPSPTDESSALQVVAQVQAAPDPNVGPVSPEFFDANSMSLPKVLSLSVIGILFLALVADTGYMAVKGMHHARSRPLAQIAFMGMIMALIIVARAGEII